MCRFGYDLRAVVMSVSTYVTGYGNFICDSYIAYLTRY